MRSRHALLGAFVLTLVGTTALQAQSRTIVGRVIDVATQQGVPGAIVAVSPGGVPVTQANENGQFRLTAPAGPLALSVRGLGYRRVETRVAAGQDTLTVTMQREALRLTEVVVTGATTTQERRTVGAAVSSVQAEDLQRVPAASLDNALQGKLVGASINMNSGAPGGGGQIQIRGVTSILGNGQPLFVVDGVIVSNQAFSTGINAVTRASGGTASPFATQDNAVNRLSDINPNDIESVQVLKSAAATAIYGSKATNGVVLITTKRGRAGEARFNVSQRVGTYSPVKLLGSRRFTKATFTDYVNDNGLSPALIDRYCASTCPYFDYQGELFGQRDLSYETTVTLTGGTENTKYFISGNDKNDRGTLINTGARRQSLRMNFDQAVGSRLTMNFSALLNRSISDRGISNNDNTYTSPMYAFGYTPAVINLQERVGGRYVNNTLLRDITGSGGSNPFQNMEGIMNREDVWRQLASGTARYIAFSTDNQTLTVQAQGGFDRFDAEGIVYSPNYLQFEPDDGFSGTSVDGSSLNFQLNGTLGVIHSFTPGEGFVIPFLSSLTTSAGAQYETRRTNSYNILARGLIPTITLVDQGTPTLFHTKQQVRDQAFFLSEDLLAFNDRFSLSGRVRAERSSTNGEQEKFFYWPAVSTAYRFVNVLPKTDELKIRANWGTSGNQPSYGQNTQVISGLGVIDGRSALGVPASIGNVEIQPEKMTEQEYGIDALFFNGRVGVEVSYFDRTITDLLLQAPLAPTSGFTQRFINGGKLKTNGIEGSLTLVPIRTRDVQWTSRTQYYTFESKVAELPANVADFAVASSGFGAQYGRGRIAREQSATLVWANRKRADGTAADTIIGESRPDFTMQFGNDLTWRGLSLNTLIDWRKGGLVSNMTNNLFDEGGNSWDYDKPSPQAGVPLGEWRYAQWDAGRNASVYIQDGSFVKLREITLSYLVPTRYSERLWSRARDVRLYASGRNLKMWSDYWGMDPEVNNFGNSNVVRFVDLAPFPASKSFFIGVDFGF